MNQVLIDTDILSAIMARNQKAVVKARAYLNHFHRFSISIITRYEILRGLKKKKAVKQVQDFDTFCDQNIIMLLTDDIIVKAADIYATLTNNGIKIGDADILIGATALVNNMAVSTNNVQHFERIPELIIENWLT